MTEQEWLESTDPRKMLELLRGESPDRKLRLFACACCRRVWNPFVTPFTIRAVAAAEAFADREVSAQDLYRVHGVATRAAADTLRDGTRGSSGYLTDVAEASAHATHPAAETAAQLTLRSAALAAADVPEVRSEHTLRAQHMPPEFADELAAQADLLRDIFGNPFQSVGIELEWLTSDVVALARGIYADRAFDRMPILADALQDAGCDDEVILGHCREKREHVRGCWVVDLLLGKS